MDTDDNRHTSLVGLHGLCTRDVSYMQKQMIDLFLLLEYYVYYLSITDNS